MYAYSFQMAYSTVKEHTAVHVKNVIHIQVELMSIVGIKLDMQSFLGDEEVAAAARPCTSKVQRLLSCIKGYQYFKCCSVGNLHNFHS